MEIHHIQNINNTDIIVYEVSGQKRYRDMWCDFFFEVQAIIFVVDPTDTSRHVKYMKLIECIITNPSTPLSSDTQKAKLLPLSSNKQMRFNGNR